MPDPRYRDPEYAAHYRASHRDAMNARARGYLQVPEKREANRIRSSIGYYANREERLARQRAYYNLHKVELAERTTARKYGLSVADYRALVQLHAGRCAVCGGQTKLAVDHDHTTGRVRGLLCSGCNLLIGHAQDDAVRLRAAADYLEGNRDA